jgi:hypothetical protein
MNQMKRKQSTILNLFHFLPCDPEMSKFSPKIWPLARTDIVFTRGLGFFPTVSLHCQNLHTNFFANICRFRPSDFCANYPAGKFRRTLIFDDTSFRFPKSCIRLRTPFIRFSPAAILCPIGIDVLSMSLNVEQPPPSPH